jgi:hypothetical protein
VRMMDRRQVLQPRQPPCWSQAWILGLP